MMRFISLLLSFVLFWTQTLMAHRTVMYPDQQRKPSVVSQSVSPQFVGLSRSLSAPSQIIQRLIQDPRCPAALSDMVAHLPAELASVDDVSLPAHPTGAWVLHIKDIHQHESTQRRLASGLKKLASTQKIDALVLEGHEGLVDLSPFRSVPDADIVGQVAGPLLKAGQISGPMYAALVYAKTMPRIVGAENRAAYFSNVRVLKRALSEGAALKGRLTSLERKVRQAKNTTYNKRLLAFDGAVQAYERNDLSLGQFARLLLASGEGSLVLQAYVEAEDLEAKISLPGVRSDARRYLEDAPHRLSSHEAVSLARYSHLKNFLQYRSLASSLNPSQVMGAVQAASAHVLSRLILTDKEQFLADSSRRITLMNKLLSFSLDPFEWSELKQFSEYPAAPTRELASLERERRQLQEKMQAHGLFYVLAEERNDHFVNNIKAEIRRSPGAGLVLVAGGFHANGVAARLKEAGVIYVSCTPATEGKLDFPRTQDSLESLTRVSSPLEGLLREDQFTLSPQPVTSAGYVRLAAGAVAKGLLTKTSSLVEWGSRLMKRKGVSSFKAQIVEQNPDGTGQVNVEIPTKKSPVLLHVVLGKKAVWMSESVQRAGGIARMLLREFFRYVLVEKHLARFIFVFFSEFSLPDNDRSGDASSGDAKLDVGSGESVPVAADPSKEVTIRGVALHSGVNTTIKVIRKGFGNGIRFKVMEGPDGDMEKSVVVGEVPAVSDSVWVGQKRFSGLTVGGKKIRTTEHLMAALSILDIWDADVCVWGDELPILDGNIASFIEHLKPMAPPPGSVNPKVYRIMEPLLFWRGPRTMFMILPLDPSEMYAQFLHVVNLQGLPPLDSLGENRYFAARFLNTGDVAHFIEEIGGHRTFVEQPIKDLSPLFSGGSDANLFRAYDPSLYGSGGKLKTDYLARHKIGDLMGDLFLLEQQVGGRILARFISLGTGHRDNHQIFLDLNKVLRHGAPSLFLPFEAYANLDRLFPADSSQRRWIPEQMRDEIRRLISAAALGRPYPGQAAESISVLEEPALQYLKSRTHFEGAKEWQYKVATGPAGIVFSAVSEIFQTYLYGNKGQNLIAIWNRFFNQDMGPFKPEDILDIEIRLWEETVNEAVFQVSILRRGLGEEVRTCRFDVVVAKNNRSAERLAASYEKIKNESDGELGAYFFRIAALGFEKKFAAGDRSTRWALTDNSGKKPLGPEFPPVTGFVTAWSVTNVIGDSLMVSLYARERPSLRYGRFMPGVQREEPMAR